MFAFSPNFHLFRENLTDIGFLKEGVNSFSCSSRLLSHFTTKYISRYFFYNTLSSTQLVGLMSYDIKSLPLLRDLIPGVVNYENLVYPYDLSDYNEDSETQKLSL